MITGDLVSPLAHSGSEVLSITDFCDMVGFDKMMRDWSYATGLATVVVDNDGNYLTGYYNFTDFCEQLVRKSPEGLRRCIACDKKGQGTYLCHTGLVDFSAPLTLTDGTVVGKIIGGQVKPEEPNEESCPSNRTGTRDPGRTLPRGTSESSDSLDQRDSLLFRPIDRDDHDVRPHVLRRQTQFPIAR
jgi:ligand-binding sensor protein